MPNWTAIVRRLYPPDQYRYRTDPKNDPFQKKRETDDPSILKRQIVIDDIAIEWPDDATRPTAEDIVSRLDEANALLRADDERRGRRKAFEKLWPAEKIIALAHDDEAMAEMLAEAVLAR